ncbi:electron transfer flavoprotein subunit alpha/FixB family protein, partial [Aeribacillus composti]
MARKVFVLGEIRDQFLRNVSFEALAAGKIISEGGEVVAGLIGENVRTLANDMIYYGADRVVIVEDEKLKYYSPDGYSQAVMAIIDSEKPDAIIFGHTALGKDLSPKIAAKLNAGLISDATAVEIVGGNVVFTRPIYSGKAFEKKIITDGIIFATVRPNNIPPLEKNESRSGEVASISVEIKDLRTIVREVVQNAAEGVDL